MRNQIKNNNKGEEAIIAGVGATTIIIGQDEHAQRNTVYHV